jgi:hypothetical protein
MSDLVSRPRKGFSADEAFARWSDSERYKELVELAQTSDLPSLMDADQIIRDPQRRKLFLSKREKLEGEFRKRLLSEEIFASAISEYSDRRDVIHPSFWDLLEISYDLDCLNANGREYKKPEFFTVDCIPLNVRPIPDWLDETLGELGLNIFRHDASYQHISLHGISYVLSPLHANVVSILYQAWLAGEPWRNGKEVLQQAGSTQLKMVDVFKSRGDWRTFIEFDGKKMYRLRMEPPKQ